MVYSFSKFFGATGWRLGAIALHDDNAFDAALAALPEEQKTAARQALCLVDHDSRASVRFIDRLVADSRAVALNHTAGLSVPQQLQMALFALNGLMDREHRYKDAAKQLIRQRYQTLYANMGIKAAFEPNDVNYYSLIDLQEIGGTLYGPEFKAWFIKSDLGISFLFRLARRNRRRAAARQRIRGRRYVGPGFARQSHGFRIRLDRKIHTADSGRMPPDFKKGIALPLQVE